ncbi:NUDIX domain-containing protein [Variovorax sp. J22R133]|uniref:NUDIX domain-containing protein n=1 Tax=Variovorax brevis TaxID=3053503 RepID=UPI002576DE5C|nr:NUDIX domain-containing protein [Variovorax sp. J22R133]MDM0113315.1 NUDIX domain-containing protein [Variovorax sp. J22R133]
MPRTVVPKACACLVDAQGRLLVFHHPGDRNMQLPKGTVEPGEAPEDAVRRELLEESGIDFKGPLQFLGTMERECRAGVEGNAFRHAQLWHLYLMRAETELPETFEHEAVGSPEEEGLVFSFSWLAPHEEPKGFKKPYLRAIARAREALSSPPPSSG